MKNDYRKMLDLDLLGEVLEACEKVLHGQSCEILEDYLPENLKNKVIMERSKVELIAAFEKQDAAKAEAKNESK